MKYVSKLPRKIIPNQNMEYQKVILGSVERFIPKFKSVMNMEMQELDDTGEVPVISPFQYLSCLFNNIGYSHCPSNMNWINCRIPIQMVPRDTMIDYPITYYPWMFNKDETYLSKLLGAIALWCRGEFKRGHLLDVKHSYTLPEVNEIQYLIDNKMIIKYGSSVDVKETFWNAADIRTTRLHNLSPLINADYFNNSIIKFNEYANYVKVKKPYAIFALSLINPDIFMSFIRNAEMEACKKASRKYNGYYTMRSDYDAIYDFQDILNRKVEHVANIYQKYGFVGLVEIDNNFSKRNNKEVSIAETMAERLSMNMVVPPLVNPMYYKLQNTHPDGSLDEFASLSYEDKCIFIENIDLTAETKAYIFKFLDKELLPDVLKAQIVYPDNTRDDTDIHKRTMKRLYVTLMQIECYFPEYLDLNEKLILSERFFIDHNKFAIYTKKMNRYIVVTPEFKSYILSPEDAIKYYANKYNAQILLDSDEVDTESGEVPDIDIENLNIVININSHFEPQGYKDYIDSKGQEYLETTLNPSNENYGDSVLRMLKE